MAAFSCNLGKYLRHRGYKTSLPQTTLSPSSKTLAFPLPLLCGTPPEYKGAREVDRHKNGVREANGGLTEATTSRLRFNCDEEADGVEMEVEESLEAEGAEEQAAEEVIGSDKGVKGEFFYRKGS
jgi:hypothetical protein